MICAIGEWLEDVLRRFLGDSLDVKEDFVAWISDGCNLETLSVIAVEDDVLSLLFDFRSDELDESAE